MSTRKATMMSGAVQADDFRVRALREPREKVNPAKLLEAVTQDVMDAQTLGLFNKMERCHRTRMCLWAGKTDKGTSDGVGYGQRLEFPWKGAIDYESKQADQLVTEFADLGVLAWLRSEKSVRPRDVFNEEQDERAKKWDKTLELMLDRDKMRFMKQLELFWNCVGEFGMSCWQESWRKLWGLGRKEMTLGQLAEARAGEMMETLQQGMTAEAVGPEGEGAAPEPELPEEQVMQIQQQALEDLTAMVLDPNAVVVQQVMALVTTVDALIPQAEARRVVTQLRNNVTQPAEYVAPMPLRDEPMHRVRIPWVNVIYPPMSNEDSEYPRVTTLDWYSEYEVRALSQQEGWNKEWTKKVLENPGLALSLTGLISAPLGWEINGFDMGLQVNTNTEALRRAGQYQIATVWYIAVDKAGLPCVYRTLIHSAAPDLVGLDEPDPEGTGKMPFLWGTRQMKRQLAAISKGIADDVLTEQLASKKLTDAMISQTELRAMPPVLRSMEGGGDGLRPGLQMSVSARNLGLGGGVKLMEVPDLSSGSVKMLEILTNNLNERYARGNEVDPEVKQTRLVVRLGLICVFYEEMLLRMCENIQVQMKDKLRIGALNGRAVNMEVDPADLQGELDVCVKCDPAAVDLKLATEKLKALQSLIVPLDRAGVLDMNKIVKVGVRWIDNDLAQMAVMSDEEASQQVASDENRRITEMAAGVPMRYEERITNPRLRLEVLQQWIQVPGNAARFEGAAMGDERARVFAEQMMKERQYLERQIVQYQENPIVGRTMMEAGAVGEG